MSCHVALALLVNLRKAVHVFPDLLFVHLLVLHFSNVGEFGLAVDTGNITSVLPADVEEDADDQGDNKSKGYQSTGE